MRTPYTILLLVSAVESLLQQPLCSQAASLSSRNPNTAVVLGPEAMSFFSLTLIRQEPCSQIQMQMQMRSTLAAAMQWCNSNI